MEDFRFINYKVWNFYNRSGDKQREARQQSHRYTRTSDPARKNLHRVLMGAPADKAYAEFKNKVKRTVYFDNLSPKATEVIIQRALNQFGTVKSIHFLPNYTGMKSNPQCALVEMESAQQAKSIVEGMKTYPFMMSGMPRPVRAFAAEENMFVDRPAKPGSKIQCQWIDPNHSDIGVAKKIYELTRKHSAEASVLLELQLEEERKLAKHQAEVLKANYKKYELMDKVQGDGTLNRLARRLQIKILDD